MFALLKNTGKLFIFVDSLVVLLLLKACCDRSLDISGTRRRIHVYVLSVVDPWVMVHSFVKIIHVVIASNQLLDDLGLRSSHWVSSSVNVLRLHWEVSLLRSRLTSIHLILKLLS